MEQGMNIFGKFYEVVLIEKRMPWRLQRILKRSFYIRHLTRYAFKAALKTRPIASDNQSAYEVSTLLDRGNINSYLLAIKSFVMHSPVPCKISIVSDGSLGPAERDLLSRHILGVNIHSPADIPEDKDDDLSVAMRHAREAFPTIRKTYDIFHTVSSENIIFLDSDYLFLKPMDRSIFDVGDHARMIYNRDHDHSVCDPLFHLSDEFIKQKQIRILKRITDLNCGFMVFSSDVFDMKRIMEFIRYLYESSSFHTVMEQDAWNILASTIPVRAMPSNYLVGDKSREFRQRLDSKDLIAVHYVSSIRYHSLHYLKNGLKVIRQLP
jgi:hypothetical protein